MPGVPKWKSEPDELSARELEKSREAFEELGAAARRDAPNAEQITNAATPSGVTLLVLALIGFVTIGISSFVAWVLADRQIEAAKTVKKLSIQQQKLPTP